MTICIISIIVISLMLLGLTYGFYLTQIDGNKNSKSIEVVTGESKVLFTDLSESATSEIIMPGYTMLKVFTVENIGNTTGKYSVFLVDVFNNFNRKEDITYVLYRSNGEVTDVNLDTNFSSWTNLTPEPVVFPSASSVIKADETIAVDDTYTYALVITYKNADVNQNEDQGKTFSASVNLRAESTETNPYSEGTLAYSIINRAKNITESDSKTNGYAMYSETLRTTPAEEISEADESLLLIADDDYTATTNKPSYYFRGNVKDNYVNFAGMCWRIVRVAGDGSTKLILEDQYTNCDDDETIATSEIYTGNWSVGIGNYGYDNTSGKNLMSYLKPVTNNNESMIKAFYDFQTTGKLKDFTGILKSGDWCLGDKAYTRSGSSGSYTYAPLEEYNYSSSMYYDAYTRLNEYNENGVQPTLKCNGTILNEFADVSGVSSKAPMYVSTITADEIVYAGGEVYSSNINYYLVNNNQENNSKMFLSLSPSSYSSSNSFDSPYFVINGFLDDSADVSIHGYSFRPAIIIAKGTKIVTGGNGTQMSPYVIE